MIIQAAITGSQICQPVVLNDLIAPAKNIKGGRAISCRVRYGFNI